MATKKKAAINKDRQIKIGDRVKINVSDETGTFIGMSKKQPGHAIVEKDNDNEEIDHIQAVPLDRLVSFDVKEEFDVARQAGIEYGNTMPTDLWEDVEDFKEHNSVNWINGWLAGVAIGLEKMAKRFPKTLAEYEKLGE